MTQESTPSSPFGSIAREHAAAILGAVSTKFQQPLENLQIRQETCEAIDGMPGEYTVLVLSKNFKMYGVHFQLDADGALTSLSCEEVSDAFTA